MLLLTTSFAQLGRGNRADWVHTAVSVSYLQHVLVLIITVI